MSEPFLSEIKIFSFGSIPRGWAACNGQFLPINQNQALFALLGTTYGGNGQTTFALPDLRGRIPIHFGGGFNQGQVGGQEAHTLTISEMPTHTHLVNTTANPATSASPNNTVGYARAGNNLYAGAAGFVAMHQQTVANTGGSQAHPNMPPYLTLTFCIALIGIFPSQN